MKTHWHAYPPPPSKKDVSRNAEKRAIQDKVDVLTSLLVSKNAF